MIKHYLSDANDVIEAVGSTADGLNASEAEKRLAENGKNKLKEGKVTKSSCQHANYCVARIWNYDMQCHEHCKVERFQKKELERNIRKG